MAQIAILKWDNALIKIPTKYADDANIFSFELAMELLDNIGINEYAIKLV